jgi:hypothetical protein
MSITRTLALAGTVTALAVAPAGAVAAPLHEPASERQAPVVAEPVSSDVTGGDADQTLALVVSGAALLVAIGGAGYAGLSGRRVGQPNH